jgi:SAM-dependent methyltransferase
MKRKPKLFRIDATMKDGILGGLSGSLPYVSGVVLDIGCGSKPYEYLLKERSVLYIGVDVPTEYSANKEEKKADIFCDLRTGLPIKNGSVDTIIATEVLEHIPNPEALLTDVRRGLKAGGYAILTTPQTWELHEEPHDYFRYTKYGLSAMANNAGFQVVNIIPHCGTNSALAQLFAIHMYNKLVMHKPFPIRAVVVIAAVCILKLGKLLDRVFPDQKLTLGNTLILRKATE